MGRAAVRAMARKRRRGRSKTQATWHGARGLSSGHVAPQRAGWACAQAAIAGRPGRPRTEQVSRTSPLSAFDIALLVASGLLGGAANALAGGGTFFTFPAMLEAGLPPVAANASNAVALYPGRFPSVVAGWRELMQLRSRLLRASAVAALGSLAGAALLLAARERVFISLIPWLLLFATLLFAAGGHLVLAMQRLKPRRGRRGLGRVLGLAFEAAVAIYGGYFGAGAAFMVMAGHAMTGIDDVRQNVALKNLVVTVMTTVSVATFIVAGAVAWRETLVMLPGAMAGGYFGARLAQRLHPGKLRGFIIAVGVALTAYYFVKLYG